MQNISLSVGQKKNTEQDSNAKFDTNWVVSYSEHNLMSINIEKDQKSKMFFVIVTLRNTLGEAHEGTIDLVILGKQKSLWNRKGFALSMDQRNISTYFIKIFFSNNNMEFTNSLENSSKRSVPRNLRKLEQTDIHRRT